MTTGNNNIVSVNSIVESTRAQHPELLNLVNRDTDGSDFRRVICVGFAIPESMKGLIEEMANYGLLWRPTIELPDDYDDAYYPVNYYQWATQNPDPRGPLGSTFSWLFHSRDPLYRDPYQLSPSILALRRQYYAHITSTFETPARYLEFVRKMFLLTNTRSMGIDENDAKLVAAFEQNQTISQ
jgi:hypothetical protein